MADRTCPGCAMNDDHPRHIVVTDDGTQKAWHKDCHQAKGCEICATELADVEPGTIGDKLRAHLLDNAGTISDNVDALSQAQLETAHGTGV